MNIAIFTDTYLPDLNGVATATKILKDVLVSHGHKVIIVCPGLKGQHKFTFKDGIMRIPGKSLRFLYGYRMSFFFNSKAFKILKKLPIDIIHIQQEFGVSIFGRICAKILNIPLIYTYHTSYADYSNYISHTKVSEKAAEKLLIKLIRKVISLKGEIITPSLKSRKALLSYGVNKYIHVIPNALDIDSPDNSNYKERESAFREKYHLEGKKILLYLGRIAKEKNISELLQGFNLYKNKYQDDNAVLLIVGFGPDMDKLIKEKDELERKDDIIFIGKVPHEDTWFYYQISDIFLSASLSETQGLTYSEAISNSLIVLAKYDSNLDFLIQDGVTGFFFDNVHSLAERIHQILTLDIEKKKTIMKQAKERNSYLFSKETYYERIIHVYEKALRHSF